MKDNINLLKVEHAAPGIKGETFKILLDKEWFSNKDILKKGA